MMNEVIQTTDTYTLLLNKVVVGVVIYALQ